MRFLQGIIGKGGQVIAQQDFSVNERIRASRVLVIDDEGNKLGVMMTRDAISLAKDKGLDLVEVAPKADPPVTRVLDYGKYLYDQKKKQRDSKKKQAQQQLKEIKLRTKTEDHDLYTKLKKAKEFLEKGDRVKIRIMYRGREMAHPELGKDVLERVVNELEPFGEPMEKATMQGRNLITVIAPYSKSQLKKREKEQQRQKEEQERTEQEEEEDREQNAST
ncbi:MAG: translation initiation factor IF-3 [bacterium]